MSRIRSIKPEFWASEQVMLCSPVARLLFIGIWNFCDDAGRHPMSAMRLKAQIFPGDDITSANVQGMLTELSENGLIEVYEVDGKEYLQVTGWQHQRIDRPQPPRFPGKGGVGAEAVVERSTKTPRTLATDNDDDNDNDKSKKEKASLFPKKAADRQKGTRLPENWTVSEADLAYARSRGMSDEDTSTQAANFHAYWTSKPGREALKLDWSKTWQTWVRNHCERKGLKPTNGHAPSMFELPAKTATEPKDRREAENRLRVGRSRLQWPRKIWGPAPHEDGCNIPLDLIQPDDGKHWDNWETER